MQHTLLTTLCKAGVRRTAACIATGLALVLGGCAASRQEYMGIPLVVGDAPLRLQLLASRARDGDKEAQYTLGLYFEHGILVPVDLERARDLYAQAAMDSGGTIWVYVPPVGKQGSGQVMPVDTGPRTPGLPEAKDRLKRLNAYIDRQQGGEVPAGPEKP